MTTLWDTTGSAVVRALADERRTAGAVTSGLVLTLVVVADETRVTEAEQAATVAASAHPCRVLIVVRRAVTSPQVRLDAEVSIGGRLGPGEAVVLRMHGRLALHAESVVLPLLAPDAPVVTWWFGAPPDLIAHDPLGVLADRRVTDVAAPRESGGDPSGAALAALRDRAGDYAPGDTDLSWTRITGWRAILAGALDEATGVVTGGRVGTGSGAEATAGGALLAAWLGSRLELDVPVERQGGDDLAWVELDVDGGGGNVDGGGWTARLERQDRWTARLTRTGQVERVMPLSRPDVGDLLAEELRRLDDDPVYAAALGRAGGADTTSARPRVRTHIWRDPAEQAAGEPA